MKNKPVMKVEVLQSKEAKENIKNDLFPVVSPVPSKKEVYTLSFPDAMREILNLHRITRLEWHDANTFGLLRDGFLMIYIRGEFHQWIINDGDLNAIDWVVIPDGN